MNLFFEGCAICYYVASPPIYLKLFGLLIKKRQIAEIEMKIIETYSHLNGLEFLIVHKPKLWDEIKKVITSIDAEKCKTKVSKEKTMKGKILYSPIDMNNEFKNKLFINIS